MAMWGKQAELDRSKLPESLRDKSPDELMQMIVEFGDVKKAAEAAETARKELETKFESQQSEFTTVKEKLAAIEARVTPPPDPPQDPPEPPSPWTDPEAFVRDQTKGIAGVALASGRMTAKMYFTQQLTPRDLKIFKKYEAEVDKGVDTFAPAAQVMPQSYFNMFLFVKGSHEADIRKAESDDPGFFSETPSRGGPPAPEPVDKLTPEEEEVCRKFHFDPKKYLAQKQAGSIRGSAKGMYSSFVVPTKGGSDAR